MLSIIHQWGADYLVFDEPISPENKMIPSPKGITLSPGQIIKQIGKKNRSNFKLSAPFTMIYEGLLQIENVCYAVFHSKAHDSMQPELFGTEIKYRYAFACVFVNGVFQCFLVGQCGPKGIRDIQLDFIE